MGLEYRAGTKDHGDHPRSLLCAHLVTPTSAFSISFVAVRPTELIMELRCHRCVKFRELTYAFMGICLVEIHTD